MRTGDFVVQLQRAEQSVQLEAEDWRLRSTTRVVLANSVVRGGVISRCSFISRC